ncbi:MAG: hypothetical protein U9R49_00315 [Bacteroidota bacterium]|nr:hypothetical protein [Bacteroidota bacterium]
MKKNYSAAILLVAIVLFTICIACNQQSDEGASTTDVRSVDPVEGVWELTSRYWVLDDDTIYADEVGVQHKIYSDGYVMWTSDPAPDSSEWHGYGTYRLSNDTLIEKLSSMSLPMKVAMGSEDEAMLIIEYDENFFKQAMEQEFRDTIYQYTEEWKKLN